MLFLFLACSFHFIPSKEWTNYLLLLLILGELNVLLFYVQLTMFCGSCIHALNTIPLNSSLSLHMRIIRYAELLKKQNVDTGWMHDAVWLISPSVAFVSEVCFPLCRATTTTWWPRTSVHCVRNMGFLTKWKPCGKASLILSGTSNYYYRILATRCIKLQK